ncbi:MAG: 4'-phosphopantetheinyl transferase superfamily protein [Bacteroidia bacterium]
MQTFNLHTVDLNQVNWLQQDYNFSLSAADVHVWIIEVDNEDVLFDKLKDILNADEIERMLRFKKKDDQLRFAYAHACLRILCSRYLGQPAAAINFTETINKKPCIEICFGNLFFNLSHSGRKILIAFGTESEVGVDIEQMRPDFKIEEFMERNYSANEINSIINVDRDEQLNLFFKYWSRKEAWLKATGIGIFSDLVNVDTALQKNEVYTDQYIPGNLKDDFYIHSFAIEDYRASIVLNNKTERLHFLKFDFDQLL